MELEVQEKIDILSNAKDVLNSIQELERMCADEVVECDKALGDIRHYCEINYPTERSKKNKVCRLMRDYSVRRRKAKDTLSVIAPIIAFVKEHGKELQKFNAGINQSKKELKRIQSDRMYTPRVLKELFND